MGERHPATTEHGHESRTHPMSGSRGPSAAMHAQPAHGAHAGHEHGAHDHAGMIADFRRRFWVSLALTVPILALSPMIQRFLGLKQALAFPGNLYVLFALASGLLLRRLAVPEGSCR
jgi:Cu2+-exporting ATPase